MLQFVQGKMYWEEKQELTHGRVHLYSVVGRTEKAEPTI
jgi:hypothetical protein